MSRSAWESLSEEDRQRVREADLVNGCGPQKFDGLVPDRVFGVDLTPSCECHDYDYLLGGTEGDRLASDRGFFFKIRDAARIATSSWGRFWLRPFYYVVAWRYYRAVRKLGSVRFNYRDPRMTFSDVEAMMAEGGRR